MSARFLLLLLAACALGAGYAQAQAPNDPKLAAIFEPIRVKYQLPALAGAIFTTDGVEAMAAVGVRKAGTNIAVTTDDLWHLGSDTKVMTAMLAGTFVVEKKLSWDDKVISFFPDLATKVSPAMREITLSQVLHHQAGIVRDLSLWQTLFLHGTTSERRVQAVEDMLEWPAFAPGTFHYSNNDYVLIGAILEKIGGKPWEDLMRERIFTPLHMDSAGFRGLGTEGKIDQPWPHLESGAPASFNGPNQDNLAYMAPCGEVHLSMTDWAKFLADQLRGGNAMPALLPASIYSAIQTPGPNGEYGYGWIIVQKSWAGGKALTHNGSNTMNFALCWLAPAKGFGVLICCNEGGEKLLRDSDEAASAMIELHQARVKSP
jgi:CubicO group peptidase (beta-lactamase class C family)